MPGVPATRRSLSNPAFLFLEKYGSLSSTSIGKESVFGTAVAPTSTVPMLGNTLASDPGLFFPKVMMGARDLQIFPLYGEQKNAGNVEAPIFPTNGTEALVAAIGVDGGATGAAGNTPGTGYGVTGTAATPTTSLGAAVTTAGATTITVSSATGIVANTTILQIDANSTVTPTTAECRLVTVVSGTTLTLSAPLNYTHLNAAVVKGVVAPFSHTVLQANTLPSLTVEKNIGGFQSLQFAGARVGKYDLKAAASDTEAQFTADVIAQGYAVLDSPSALNIVNEEPFVFAEYTLQWDSNTLAQASNVALSVDNGLKATYTFNGSHELQFLTPVTVKANGTFDVVFDSLDDATYGYFTQMQNGTAGAVSIALTHPSSGGSITITLGAVRLAKVPQNVKMDDVVMETVSFEAYRNLSGTPTQTVGATIVNGQFLPY